MNTKITELETSIKKMETELNSMKKNLESQKSKTYKRWRAERGGVYYSVDSEGDVVTSIEYRRYLDDYRYSIGNYYKTEEGAIKVRDRELAIVRVNDRIRELNEGWEPDWCSIKEKFIIVYDRDDSDFKSISAVSAYKFAFNLDFLISQNIANQIISEMQDDLKLIFNIK